MAQADALSVGKRMDCGVSRFETLFNRWLKCLDYKIKF